MRPQLISDQFDCVHLNRFDSTCLDPNQLTHSVRRSDASPTDAEPAHTVDVSPPVPFTGCCARPAADRVRTDLPASWVRERDPEDRHRLFGAGPADLVAGVERC